jgi:hypothetical protein
VHKKALGAGTPQGKGKDCFQDTDLPSKMHIKRGEDYEIN